MSDETPADILWQSTEHHEGGVKWFDAPIPKSRHRCWAQSTGWVNLKLIWRCPCGAMAVDPGDNPHWLQRNSRTKTAIEQPSLFGELMTKFFKRGRKR